MNGRVTKERLSTKLLIAFIIFNILPLTKKLDPPRYQTSCSSYQRRVVDVVNSHDHFGLHGWATARGGGDIYRQQKVEIDSELIIMLL